MATNFVNSYIQQIIAEMQTNGGNGGDGDPGGGAPGGPMPMIPGTPGFPNWYREAGPHDYGRPVVVPVDPQDPEARIKAIEDLFDYIRQYGKVPWSRKPDEETEGGEDGYRR